MRVVNIRDMIPGIEEVPGDYIQCSVSGEYRPPSEFSSHGNRQTRTNCTATYLMPNEKMRSTSELLGKLRTTRLYRDMVRSLEIDHEFFRDSISVQAMIDAMVELRDRDPEARLVISQSGYYCSGRCADIYTPELVHAGQINYFSIGHSSQHP